MKRKIELLLENWELQRNFDNPQMEENELFNKVLAEEKNLSVDVSLRKEQFF